MFKKSRSKSTYKKLFFINSFSTMDLLTTHDDPDQSKMIDQDAITELGLKGKPFKITQLPMWASICLPPGTMDHWSIKTMDLCSALLRFLIICRFKYISTSRMGTFVGRWTSIGWPLPVLRNVFLYLDYKYSIIYMCRIFVHLSLVYSCHLISSQYYETHPSQQHLILFPNLYNSNDTPKRTTHQLTNLFLLPPHWSSFCSSWN